MNACVYRCMMLTWMYFLMVVYIIVNINSLCIFMSLRGERLVRVNRVNSDEAMHEVVFKQP